MRSSAFFYFWFFADIDEQKFVICSFVLLTANNNTQLQQNDKTKAFLNGAFMAKRV